MSVLLLLLLLGMERVVQAETERKGCSPFDEPPPARSNNTERLGMLRAEMKRAHSVQGAPLEAYIVTSYDNHLNENPSERDRRLEWISGYTGSEGVAVVTEEKAALWVPSYYLTQANLEIPCDWALLSTESDSMSEWMAGEVQTGLRIGADPRTLPNSRWERLAKELNEKSIYLIQIQNNLVDLIWYSKPNYTFYEAMPLIYENSGDAWFTKVSQVRSALKKEECDALVVTALDEIAWLLNLRARDLPFSPLLRAYLIISQDQIHLYADKAKITEKIKTRLRIEGCYTAKCVRLHGYEIIWEDLGTMSQKWEAVCLPTETAGSPGVSRAIYFAVPVVKRKSIVSPIMLLKAEKNEREREGMKNAHLEDAVAMCYALAFIENKMREGEIFDEQKIAELMDSARRERPDNEGLSMGSSVGFGAHGALPYYQPRNATSVEVNRAALLRISSGGHYPGGTTVVSRSLHFGRPSSEEKEVYTRVLMGLIDFSRLVFPESQTVGEIDSFGRTPLWASEKDYPHPTGYGVGSFLSVREGPIVVSRNQDGKYTYKDGYFLSVGPGYYKEDKYGIRLENVLEVVTVNKTNSREKYFAFNTMTLVPFEPKLIQVSMLSPQQVKWLNAYNSRIRNEVGPLLKKYHLMTAFYWMMDKVTYIPLVELSFSAAPLPATAVHSSTVLLIAFSVANLASVLYRRF